MRLTFKSVNLGSARLFSMMWMGLIQSVEGLNRTKKNSFPSKRKFSSKLLVDCNCTTSSPGSPAFQPSRFFPDGASGKKPTCQCRRHKRPRFSLWVGKIPWRRARQPTPVFLPGESHRQRSLVGYSPQGRKESVTPETTQDMHTVAENFLILPHNFQRKLL